MLQRIQSVFLLLALVANVSSLFMPYWQFRDGDETEWIGLMEVTTVKPIGGELQAQEMQFFEHTAYERLIPHVGALGLAGLSSLLLLIVIFMYRKRIRQARTAYWTSILILLQVGLMAYLVWPGPLTIAAGLEDLTPQPALGLPFLAVILTWIAASRIRADEKLVRSVDRIR
jgi:hypothetical protein